MKNNHTPEIRFAVFTGDWEERKLGELCDEFQSGKNIKSEDIRDEGRYPVFGGNGFRGYTNTYNHDGLYALIGRQGALCGNMNISYGKAYFTEHAIAVKGNKNNETRFLFYLLGKMDLGQYSGQSAQPGLAVNKLKDLPAFIPTFAEQAQISKFFKKLDTLIALHQQELTTLKQTKQGFLQKMFPKEGESVPEVRFPGFTGEWEERMLGEILKVNSGKDYKHLQQGDIPVYGTSGYMLSVNGKLSDENAIGIGRKGTIDHPQLLKAPFWTVDTLFFMTTKEKNDLLFCYSLANKINWKKYDESTGVPSLSKASIVKISVRIPTLAEQEKIGNFFKQLDDTIALHQRELDALKETKKAFLQKMFV